MPAEIFRDGVLRMVEEEGAQLLEVLPAGEYAEQHLPGAINIPLKKLNEETAARLSRDLPIIAYCYDYQ